MNSMRVGYVLKRYPRYSETFVVNEILAHEAAGTEIDIFSLRYPSDGHFQDVIARVRAPVHYLRATEVKASSLWASLRSARERDCRFTDALKMALNEDATEVYQALELAKHLEEKRITHLHAHFGTSATSVARLASAFSGIPYTFTAHAKDIFHQSVDTGDLRRKLEGARAVVTVSDFNLEYLRENWGSAAEGVVRVYNGLDLDRFPFRSPTDREPIIVAVGRLVEKKGFSCLVDACGILAERGTPFRCKLIGAGPESHPLSEQIDKLGLSDRVELVGPRPQREVIAEISTAAVFAAPCVLGADGNRDGLPTVLLEAMALGTPCVSTDVTGIPEVVRDGQTGLVVGQHDAAMLAEACGKLLADPGKRCRLAGRARELIETAFDVHRNAAQVRELFAGAIPQMALVAGGI